MPKASQLLASALKETGEPLCNILWYAACYLAKANSVDEYAANINARKAEILRKYSDLLFQIEMEAIK